VIVCSLVCPLVQSATLENTEYAIWGFENNKLSVPSGCVVTDAVLTVQGIASDAQQLKVHLLDNPLDGLEIGNDEGLTDYFGGAGVVLNGSYEGGDMVYRLSGNDNPASSVWDVFQQPCMVSLTDSSTAQLTSSLLELIDFAGTGIGFGFGLDIGGTQKLSYYNVILDVVISPYAGSETVQTLRYKLFDLPDMPDPVVENLLVNGGLESGDTAWINYSSWSIVQDAANAYVGDYCLRFESGPDYSGDYAAYQYVQVQPGKTYSLSALMKNDSNKEMRLLVVYQNAAQRYIGHVYGASYTGSSYALSELEFTTPAGCENLIIATCVFGVQQNDGTLAYADECILEALD
jgi:hypothetical protein